MIKADPVRSRRISLDVPCGARLPASLCSELAMSLLPRDSLSIQPNDSIGKKVIALRAIELPLLLSLFIDAFLAFAFMSKSICMYCTVRFLQFIHLICFFFSHTNLVAVMVSPINDFSNGTYKEVFPVTMAPARVDRAELLQPIVDDILAHQEEVKVALGIILLLLFRTFILRFTKSCCRKKSRTRKIVSVQRRKF
jgi:hypothetical protein